MPFSFKSLFTRDEAPSLQGATRRAVDIGWFLDTTTARLIWAEPKRVKRSDPPPRHAKSVNYCPAILDHEARLFEVACPIDVRLRFTRGANGQPALVNVDGDGASIRGKHLNQMLAIVSEREWRHPERPIVQFITPYVFLSDEPVYVTQTPPYQHYRAEPWPGQVIGGRFPIDVWLRPLMWAFEWIDTGKDLVLKRGDPWFYVRFESFDPARPMRLFEAARTPAVTDYMQGMAGVSNYVDKTFSLFKTARERRPTTLLVKKGEGEQIA